MTSILKWHTCWSTVYTVVLWRADLVTSCFSLVSWMHLTVRPKLSSVMLRLLPSIANATDYKVWKGDSAGRSRGSSIAHSAFLPHFTSKVAACPCSSSSSCDSHKRRTCPVQSILAWTDRSLLLLEWHPTKPQSSSNCLFSVGELSVFAAKITCVSLFHQNCLRSDNSATLNFSPLVTGLFRFSMSIIMMLQVAMTITMYATAEHWCARQVVVGELEEPDLCRHGTVWPHASLRPRFFTLAPACRHAQALQVLGAGVAQAKAPGNLSFPLVSRVQDAPRNLKGVDTTWDQCDELLQPLQSKMTGFVVSAQWPTTPTACQSHTISEEMLTDVERNKFQNR